MLRSFVVALSLSVVAGAGAQAQTVRTPVAPVVPVSPVTAFDAQRFQAAMVAAEAASVKPGDEALACEALQRELVVTMNDQAIQAYAAKTNAAYAKELAVREKTKAPMTAEAAAALAAALNPGMAMAGLTGLPGQAVTAEQMQQMMMVQMQQLTVIMPVLMRSQRVTQLALVKNCTWAGGGLGLYPGAVIPDAVPPSRVR